MVAKLLALANVADVNLNDGRVYCRYGVRNGDRRMASGIELTATEAAVERLADEGFDPEFGARPVKRAIHRMVLNRLSRDIIAGTVTSDHPIVVDTAADGSITFHN